MGGMQNVVTHEYFQVDLNRVWETIQNDKIIENRFDKRLIFGKFLKRYTPCPLLNFIDR